MEEEIWGLWWYLEKGGFLWADDLWGDRAWRFFETEMARIFLPLEETRDMSVEDPDTTAKARALLAPDVTALARILATPDAGDARRAVLDALETP